MVPLMDYPAPVGLLSAAGELSMPFSNGEVLHPGNLGHSSSAGAGDLGMAGPDGAHRTHTTISRADTVNSEGCLYSEEKSQNSRETSQELKVIGWRKVSTECAAESLSVSA
ncbi:hypothetical protein FQN60_014462 [Etheostoma spectabile]|uniref:Uncharacterized protein n=1 Tax=Etheostoma spectabile TaxID=54343 RepID=A0A5J5D743_9PERO|nr:hypothetical protein FQN60_014462 [Etheostoma spectabile]